MEYETKGKPAKNSGLFASAHGQWGNVADMVKSRMISAGAKVEVKQLKRKFQTIPLSISGDVNSVSLMYPSFTFSC